MSRLAQIGNGECMPGRSHPLYHSQKRSPQERFGQFSWRPPCGSRMSCGRGEVLFSGRTRMDSTRQWFSREPGVCFFSWRCVPGSSCLPLFLFVEARLPSAAWCALSIGLPLAFLQRVVSSLRQLVVLAVGVLHHQRSQLHHGSGGSHPLPLLYTSSSVYISLPPVPCFMETGAWMTL